MIRQLQKPYGQALALTPYIVENPAGGALPIRDPMPGVHFQFVILCAEGEGM
jgi:hypothetical protein